jgi:hypothetical protein
METKTAKQMKGFKFIKEDMTSKQGNHRWELGKWYKHDGKLEICKSGFHACLKPHQALDYIYGDKFFLVEARGKIIHKKDDKFVASEMRLVKELPLKEISVKYACTAARMCLKNFQKEFPEDKRPEEAIQAAEDYMDKKINLDELNKKVSAAWSAAESAAESAARSAARSARSAAECAAWSAWSAARSARSAAGSAARSARSAGSAADSALHKEYNKITRSYL